MNAASKRTNTITPKRDAKTTLRSALPILPLSLEPDWLLGGDPRGVVVGTNPKGSGLDVDVDDDRNAPLPGFLRV